MKIAVLGATGRMGRLLVAEIGRSADLVLVAAASRSGARQGIDAGTLAGVVPAGVPVTAVGPGWHADADVVVDFSLPEALAAALPTLGACPLVTGTTGLDADQMAQLREHAARAPVVAASNFSTGLAVVLELAARAAAALPNYHVEIVETHHAGKLDAPSGTALALGRAVAGARCRDLDTVADHGRVGRTDTPRAADRIGFHALRGGDVVGEHEVMLFGPGERVRIAHVCTDRATFARGALRAARWVRGREPGAYTMRDVLAPA